MRPNDIEPIVTTKQYVDGTDLVTIVTTREPLQQRKDDLDSQAENLATQKQKLDNVPTLPADLVGKAQGAGLSLNLQEIK